jgi:hypothetical protein
MTVTRTLDLTGALVLTMASPTHALAFGHVDDLMRTAANERRIPRRRSRRVVRTAATGALRWLRLGQLGIVNPCTDC